MSLVLAHKTNNPANAMVIFSLLENGGFHPMFQNYHHGYIAIGYLGALGGINIMLPEQEVDDAKSFVSSVKEIEDFDPLPDPLVRDIVQASIITVNPFFFVYHLSPIIQFIAFWMLVGFEVLFFSISFSMAIITNLVSIFYILMIAHAKYVAVPKLRQQMKETT